MKVNTPFTGNDEESKSQPDSPIHNPQSLSPKSRSANNFMEESKEEMKARRHEIVRKSDYNDKPQIQYRHGLPDSEQ